MFRYLYFSIRKITIKSKREFVNSRANYLSVVFKMVLLWLAEHPVVVFICCQTSAKSRWQTLSWSRTRASQTQLQTMTVWHPPRPSRPNIFSSPPPRGNQVSLGPIFSVLHSRPPNEPKPCLNRPLSPSRWTLKGQFVPSLGAKTLPFPFSAAPDPLLGVKLCWFVFAWL